MSVARNRGHRSEMRQSIKREAANDKMFASGRKWLRVWVSLWTTLVLAVLVGSFFVLPDSTVGIISSKALCAAAVGLVLLFVFFDTRVSVLGLMALGTWYAHVLFREFPPAASGPPYSVSLLLPIVFALIQPSIRHYKRRKSELFFQYRPELAKAENRKVLSHGGAASGARMERTKESFDRRAEITNNIFVFLVMLLVVGVGFSLIVRHFFGSEKPEAIIAALFCLMGGLFVVLVSIGMRVRSQDSMGFIDEKEGQMIFQKFAQIALVFGAMGIFVAAVGFYFLVLSM